MDHTYNNIWVWEILQKLHFFLKLSYVSLFQLKDMNTIYLEHKSTDSILKAHQNQKDETWLLFENA